MLDINRLFPPHYSLYLEHNDHKGVYETVKDYIGTVYHPEDFESEEDMQKCILNNDVWRLQVYYRTAIGFYCLLGSDPSRLFDRLWETYKEDVSNGMDWGDLTTPTP